MISDSQVPSTTNDIAPEQMIDLNDNSSYGNAQIKVIGVGGGGSNAVGRMFRDKVPGVEYSCVNTDAQHLDRCDVPNKISIGHEITRGLGVGGHPEIGRQAAEESREDLTKLVTGADMVFVTAGMGGGTGTGSAPVIAELAKESGALTVAVVSKPFSFEVTQRKKNADEGLAKLRDVVDTLITIPNDRLLQLNKEKGDEYTWEDALKMADSVLAQGIQSIAEVVTVPGEINVDFADIKTIMGGAGPAWMAIGRGNGENRAVNAARQATKSPLLDIAIEGAKRILFVISGGSTLSLKEVQQASDTIQDMADPEANVIFGTCKDPRLDDEVKITLIAAAFPMPEESLHEREQELKRLLRDALPNENDLDTPSFFEKRPTKIVWVNSLTHSRE